MEFLQSLGMVFPETDFYYVGGGIYLTNIEFQSRTYSPIMVTITNLVAFAYQRSTEDNTPIDMAEFYKNQDDYEENQYELRIMIINEDEGATENLLHLFSESESSRILAIQQRIKEIVRNSGNWKKP